MANKISIDKAKELINYFIDTNIKLQEDGKDPISIGLEANAGVGKTSIVEQVAKERNMGFVSIRLAEMEEAGDLTGFPITEYECQILKRIEENGEKKITVLPKSVWVNQKQLEEGPGANMKFKQTGRTRMSYSKPAWVPEYNENGTIILMDDYSRANPQLLGALMQIIYKQEYISWKLPKKTTLITTSNMDNGEYNVQSLDEAQASRLLNYEVEFSLQAWMNWAEKAKIDGRCINFVASYSNELFNSDEEGNRICNPRSFTMFANAISPIKDWDNADNLDTIKMIANGCFKDDGKFSKMFTAFIRNKMHMIIQPNKMLLGDWSEVKGILESTLYDSDGTYRPDISNILERRFASYVDAWLSSDGKTPIEKVKKRICDFINNEDNNGRRIFTKDQYYHMIKTIMSTHKNQTNQLLFEPRIAKIIS